MRKLVFLIGLAGFSLMVKAARVDTLSVKSVAMGATVEVVVISPDAKQANTPVVYLLHGHSGNAHSWMEIKSDLPEIADERGLIFVCPDGKNSWYWDSPRNPAYRYETFVAKELVEYIDVHYSTRKVPAGRAIAGFSMGGHGALWLAVHHRDVFGAAGSMSGGVDIRPFPNNWEMAKQLGDLAGNSEVWERHTVINAVEELKDGELAIVIDCGYDDFFAGVNEDLHRKLLRLGVRHDYYVRPGGHTAAYWRNAVDFQLVFFCNYFRNVDF